ncbi:2-amino-4-hydroxy-6-hydroxymethyldihydropteridine diphosphokinase [Altericroceibacterium spongiae]|uniref:2-amino-4-hydroxy-6-hydroxymethyldihydropteridine pyrophosphokinase n=1 Tax=Altericroceibacterium spongiae TaxID=2320269 RepID=A0A420EQ55_9SPHN|nr:2-amino-4-hydroxy-6-hydroxymethyldihydropteridine diphosphokinase [Altericroceibacterium spongiae]RKF22798.1 2-amino-4-hydroxy-6-hydroxymethyldihydropteridine diphosphokinase [Altericroceibacterium spongiae]
MREFYLVALGSNQRHHRFGSPRVILGSVAGILESAECNVLAVAPVITSDPVGPSMRRYANGALLLATERKPEELLRLLKQIEAAYDRDNRGQRWRSRTLDLDIILWSGGAYESKILTIPHRLFRERRFVTGPASAICGDWRDPSTNFTVKQLHARLTKPHTPPRERRVVGPLAQSVEQLTFNQ